MLRNILGIVGGYLAMAIFIFITFTIMYVILGTEGSFQSGSYQASTVWLIMSILLSIIAAVLGGYVCVLIARNQKAGFVLAGVVLILGLIMAIPVLTANDDGAAMVRNGEVSSMDAMTLAKQPTWISLLNPLIGAIGVFYGSRLKKEG